MKAWMLLAGLVFLAPAHAFADAEKDFAAALEEMTGHFWALEQNLDDGNAELALVHATHPIAELYDTIKPELAGADPDMDMRLRMILLELKDKTGPDVPTEQAREAIQEARDAVEAARNTVVGDLYDGHDFKIYLMGALLETSAAEYHEAVSGGAIENLAEFQDGSAFVWRSQQILYDIRPEIDSDAIQEIDHLYEEIWSGYEDKKDPDYIESHVSRLIDALGGDVEKKELLDYVDTINVLLADAKSEYRDGNADVALSYVTRAYLDNYEFLEAPLQDAGEEELMEEIEVMLREELRSMIKSGAPVAEVDAQIGAISERMGTVAVIVPEFGSIAAVILAVAIVSVIILTGRRMPGMMPR